MTTSGSKQVYPPRIEQPEGRSAVGHHDDVVALTLESPAGECAHHRLVFDHEHASAPTRASRSAGEGPSSDGGIGALARGRYTAMAVVPTPTLALDRDVAATTAATMP